MNLKFEYKYKKDLNNLERHYWLLKCLLDEMIDDELEKFSNWEKKFVLDLAKQAQGNNFQLSNKQRFYLERIYKK